MQMKITKLIIFLNLLLLFISCNGQTKPIEEEALDLLNFNFDTRIETLISEKYKSKIYKDYYNIPRKYFPISFKKDTIFVDRFAKYPIAVGIEYSQKASSNMDTLAVFKNQTFNRINFATNFKNEITVVCAVADEMTKIESQNFLNILKEKYGKYKKTEGEFGGKFFIYEWEINNKIIKYSSIFNDENSTIKIAMSNDSSIVPVDKEPHFEGYLYLLRKDYIDEAKNLNSGDFVFIDE